MPQCNDSETNILLGVIYRPPSQNAGDDAELLRKMGDASILSDVTIIVGDFNMPGINWLITEIPSYKTPEALLATLVCDTNLHQIVTKPTRYTEGNLPSTLDLIFINDEQVITNINNLQPVGRRDNLQLLATIQMVNSASEAEQHCQTYYIYFRANYEEINESILEDNCQIFNEVANIDTKWNAFASMMARVVEEHVRMKHKKHTIRQPWITQLILKKIREKKKQI